MSYFLSGIFLCLSCAWCIRRQQQRKRTLPCNILLLLSLLMLAPSSADGIAALFLCYLFQVQQIIWSTPFDSMVPYWVEIRLPDFSNISH